MSLRTPVSPVWYCGGELVGGGRFPPNHRWNQMRVHLYARSNSGAAVICGDFTLIDWRKAKNLS